MAAHLAPAGRWLLRWALLMALWLVLLDTKQWVELTAGGIAAAIGATVAGLIVRPGQPKTLSKSLAVLGLGPRQLGRPLVRLVLDSLMFARALGRTATGHRPNGRFRAARYRPEQARRSAAGRAVTEIWGSLAPNRYVIGTDEEEGIVLVHELIPTEEPIDPLAGR